MRILVLSRTAWRKDNSFGNTYSNIFSNMENIQIANIYLGDGIPDPDNKNVESYYCISEKEMTKSVLKPRKKSNQVGTRVVIDDAEKGSAIEENYEKAMVQMKKKRWPLFYIARELVWKFGQTNLDDMMRFVNEFKPDVIFLSFYYAAYVDRIALYIKSKIDIPLVLEAAIDIYSLKQLSFDPFFWINRFNIRRMIRKTVKKSEKLYVISEKMKRDYERMLHINCGVLYKFPDRGRKQYDYLDAKVPLNFLYAGNIGVGRWKSLAALGTYLERSRLGKLNIYTPTPLTKEMETALTSAVVHPPVSSKDVIGLQNGADVLVHAESFDLKSKLEVRYSISTKIMDYLSIGRCIFAIGPKDIASIEYLCKNDLALIANTENDIDKIVHQIYRDPSIVTQYAKKADLYIDTLMSIPTQQEILRNDLSTIVERYKKNF